MSSLCLSSRFANIVFMARQPPVSLGLLYEVQSITLRHTKFGRTPLDKWLARRRDLNLTTHNTHKTQTPMPQAGFELAIPESEQP